jgi:protein-disulfide isomerase
LAALVLGGAVLAYHTGVLMPWSADRGREPTAPEDPATTSKARNGKARQQNRGRTAKAAADEKSQQGVSREASAAELDLLKPGPLPDLVMGHADAPVTIIEYASMTCPHCATFHNDVLPVLKERYIDKGQVRLVFREFPLEDRAMLASMAARCAGAGKALALISILFARQDEWSRSKSLDEFRDKLFTLGREAGLTKQAFDACVPATKELSAQQQKLLSDIEKVRARANEKFGVRATPTFFIDGRKRVGGTVKDFEKAIEPLIKR